MNNTNTLQVNGENNLLQMNYDPNVHAMYFQITNNGELSLKPEFRGAPATATYKNAVSDQGIGIAGSQSAALPEYLVIPEIVGEVAVDSIAPGAFYGNMTIKTVVFPCMLKEIPEACFSDCVNLENVYNVEYVTDVGPSAFQYSDLKTINLPELRTLGESAFRNCSCLTHVNIGKVTTIPGDCFLKCYALSRVESGCLVTEVGHTALHNTPNLANADFVKNLTNIGNGAFIKSGLNFNWSELNNCTFGTNATPLQIQEKDGVYSEFWSNCTHTPCRNPMPTVLSQKDPRWADRHIGNTKVTYGSGCLLFCMMHIYCGFNDLQLPSVEVFETIAESKQAGLLNSYSKRMEDVNDFLNPLGLTATIFREYDAVNGGKTNLQRLYDALQDGKYAIIDTSSGKTDGSMHGHAVVAYGLTEDGKILFADSSHRYYNHKEQGGVTYALPYKTVAAPFCKEYPEKVTFCIVERMEDTTAGENGNSSADGESV